MCPSGPTGTKLVISGLRTNTRFFGGADKKLDHHQVTMQDSMCWLSVFFAGRDEIKTDERGVDSF